LKRIKKRRRRGRERSAVFSSSWMGEREEGEKGSGSFDCNRHGEHRRKRGWLARRERRRGKKEKKRPSVAPDSMLWEGKKRGKKKITEEAGYSISVCP